MVMLYMKSISKPIAYCPSAAITYLENGEEDAGVQFRLRWQTDSHQGTTLPKVIDSLGVSAGAGSGDDGGIGTRPASDPLDLCDDILGLGEVDPSIRTELLHAKLTLLLSTVDGDYSKTHGFRVLDCKMAETSTSTRENDPVVGKGLGILEGAIYGNTCAEDGGGCFGADALGNGGDDVDPRLDVLLECTIGGVSAEFDAGAV